MLVWWNLLIYWEWWIEWWSLLSWKEKSGGSARIEKRIMAYLCNFDENNEGNVVQKYNIWLVIIEKNLKG